MSRRRERNLARRPVEQTVELELSEFVGMSGVVHVERHSHDWRDDDLLVQIRLRTPIGGDVLTLFMRELQTRMRASLMPGTPCADDWLIVIEAQGQSLGTVGCGALFLEDGDGRR